MKKKDIENKVRENFAKATPNVYGDIERDVASLNVDRTPKRKPASRGLFWKLTSGILSLVLVVMAIVGVVSNVNQTAQAATVSLDVNPSVEIVLNRNNRVVKVNALNEDGKIIVADMDFNGCQLKVAVNALIGSMLRAGYLSEMANSVLVSVDSDSKNDYQAIAELVANEITLTLKQGQIEASVVKQWIQNDDEIAQIAKQYNISLGKAQLICKIGNKTEYTIEQLAELSVNELSLLLPNVDIDGDVEQSGNASVKNYIEEGVALQAALTATKIESLNAQTEGLNVRKNKLDFDDGEMVYEVEFAYGDYEYEAEVGAMSGKVVAFERELAKSYVTDAAQKVIEDRNGAKAYALTLAGVEEEAVQGSVYVEQTRYFRGTVYEVYFRTENMFYQYCVGADGVVIEEHYEMLGLSSEDSYLTRNELNKWFIDNNADGFTRLDRLERLRVTSEKTVDGKLIYTLSFVSNGNQYVYKIDAVSKSFVSREVSEYENAVKEDIKDKLHDMFEHDDKFHGMPWDIDEVLSGWNWDDWDWDDEDEFEWEFEYDGVWYEVEIDRYGNVWYDFDDEHEPPHGGPHGGRPQGYFGY